MQYSAKLRTLKFNLRLHGPLSCYIDINGRFSSFYSRFNKCTVNLWPFICLVNADSVSHS